MSVRGKSGVYLYIQSRIRIFFPLFRVNKKKHAESQRVCEGTLD